MSLEEVAGASYGPYQLRISPEKVREFVAATSDEPDRWDTFAPPGFAAALLFVAAPHFLADARVRPYTGVLVHVDQTFAWHGALEVGTQIKVTGRVEQVRERSGRYFVTFATEVEDRAGDRLLDATATFLMGRGGDQQRVDGEPEPAVWRRDLNDIPSPHPWPGVAELPPLAKSASRVDLVKYAAASGDYNPIHFDHDAARAAGLPGIVAHGLLVTAWALQVACSVSPRPDPVAHLKVRFRNPLRPGAQARVTGRVGDVAPDGADAQVKLQVAVADELLVTADAVVRPAG
jgi:acyl dehydratase